MSAGTLHELHINSRLLKGNPLGNPSRRQLMVYTPPEFKKGESIPCIIFLPGFGADPIKWRDRDFAGYQLLEWLILRGDVPRAALVCFDGMTRLGGSQYVDSKLNGPFATHLIKEVLSYLDKKFGLKAPYYLSGHSSGGFGTLHIAPRYPKLFPKIAALAPDCHFELSHKHMLGTFFNEVTSGKTPDRMNLFLKNEVTNYVLGGAAAYSPNLRNSQWKVDLPIDLKTGGINEKAWQRWMDYDPVVDLQRQPQKFAKLQKIYLSCGNRDDHFLHIGVQLFAEIAKKHKIKTEVALHNGTHKLLVRQLEGAFRALLSG